MYIMITDKTSTDDSPPSTATISSHAASHRPCPCILSLDELQIQITDEVYDYLAAPFRMASAGEDDEEDADDTNNNDTTTIATAFTSRLRNHRRQRRRRLRSSKSLNCILQRMKIPPKTTILRLTQRPFLPNNSERQDILEQVQMAMEEWILQSQSLSSSSSSRQQQLECQVRFHPIVSDVISIDIIQSSTTSCIQETETGSSSLYSKRVPPPPPPLAHDDDSNNDEQTPVVLFSEQTWPWRKLSGWPCTHAIVIVDRLCGEAVLRGADIFVKGILVADVNIIKGQVVAVYADLGITIQSTTITTRGQHLQHYTGHAIFLGLGTAACRRALFFSQSHGLGVRMSSLPWQRAGPVLPPLMANVNSSSSNSNSSKTLLLEQLLASGQVHAQNLPSAMVAHVLDPQPGQIIFDMCAAPGGKTSHVAQLVRAATAAAAAAAATANSCINLEKSAAAAASTTIIVMADKSRKKVIQARGLFQRLLGDNNDGDGDADAIVAGTTITPLHLDSTNCVDRQQDVPRQSVQEILSNAEPSPKDGLLQVTRFFPESFHRILLDPPCSALGLRPKLKIPQQTVQELTLLVNYQQCLVREAIHLLQVDGILTYSTCTVNYHENEGMVGHILKEYPCMELLPIPSNLGGRPGLLLLCCNSSSSKEFSGTSGCLNEVESSHVRRFGSTDDPDDDTIGFFIAKFRKRYSMNS